MRKTLEQRFWEKINKDGPIPDYAPRLGPCWLWTASTASEGYGYLWSGTRDAYAHRISYELLVGPIPEGLVIDHLCRVIACVNPAHLEAVTTAENIRRGTAAAVTRERSANRTHCKRGHPFDAANTYWDGNARNCRTCKREWMANRRWQLIVAGGRV